MMGTVPQDVTMMRTAPQSQIGNHDGNCASNVTMMVTVPQICNHDGNCASKM